MSAKSSRSTLFKALVMASMLAISASLAIACGGGSVDGATMVKDDWLATAEFQDYVVFIAGDNEPSGFQGVPAGTSAFLTVHGGAVRGAR